MEPETLAVLVVPEGRAEGRTEKISQMKKRNKEQYIDLRRDPDNAVDKVSNVLMNNVEMLFRFIVRHGLAGLENVLSQVDLITFQAFGKDFDMRLTEHCLMAGRKLGSPLSGKELISDG
jgi:hypothetical protein